MLNGKGQDTKAARGTVWGALNGMTRYVDHEKQARSDESRLQAAWFGPGDALKTAAFKRFASMAGVTVDAEAA